MFIITEAFMLDVFLWQHSTYIICVHRPYLYLYVCIETDEKKLTSPNTTKTSYQVLFLHHVAVHYPLDIEGMKPLPAYKGWLLLGWAFIGIKSPIHDSYHSSYSVFLEECQLLGLCLTSCLWESEFVLSIHLC